MNTEEIVNSRECQKCANKEICKHKDDFVDFVNRITNISEKLNGEIIAEGIVGLSVNCRYYTQIKIMR